MRSSFVKQSFSEKREANDMMFFCICRRLFEGPGNTEMNSTRGSIMHNACSMGVAHCIGVIALYMKNNTVLEAGIPTEEARLCMPLLSASIMSEVESTCQE